jgi:hypothetical protein
MEGEADGFLPPPPPPPSLFPSSPSFLASSKAKKVSLETLSAFSEALSNALGIISLSNNHNAPSSTAKPPTSIIISLSKSGFRFLLEIFGYIFLKICSPVFRKSWKHMSPSIGFLAVSAIVRHQRPTLPASTRRSMLNTRLRVDLTRGRMSPTRRHVWPLSRCSTSFYHPRWSSGSLTGSWTLASPITRTLLVFGHFNLLFSLFSYSVMLLCFYSVTCLCCFLLKLICLGFALFVSEVVFFFFISFLFFLETIFPIVTMYLNLYGFFESLFRCLIRVFKLLMIVFIKLCRGKGFIGLHSQMTTIFTYLEEFVVCLDLVYLSKLFNFMCLSCIFLML